MTKTHNTIFTLILIIPILLFAKDETTIESVVIPDHMATTPAKEFHPHVKNKWSGMKKNLDKINKKKTELIFLGDSITARWSTGRPSWNTYYSKYNVQNFAIGADTTHGVLRRIKEGNFKGFSPKVVVILIGVNNCAWGPKHTVQETAEGVLKIVQTLHNDLPKTKFLMIGLLPKQVTKTNFRWQQGDEVNSIIERYADNKRVFYMDIGEYLVTEDGKPVDKAFGDGVHLSPVGHEIWAKAMDQKLTELMEDKRENLRSLDFRVNLSSKGIGKEVTAMLSLKASDTFNIGRQLELTLPAGFHASRTETKISKSSESFVSMKAFNPIITFTLKKTLRRGQPLNIEITKIQNPKFKTETAPFTLEVRNRDGEVQYQGFFDGVKIR